MVNPLVDDTQNALKGGFHLLQFTTVHQFIIAATANVAL
jgi:hypothetical protein